MTLPRATTYVPSKFGRQPFYDMIMADGRTAPSAARVIGFNPAYVQRVAHGRVAPTPEFRKALSKFMCRPVKELFTESALAAVYVRRPNARADRQTSGGGTP